MILEGFYPGFDFVVHDFAVVDGGLYDCVGGGFDSDHWNYRTTLELLVVSGMTGYVEASKPLMTLGLVGRDAFARLTGQGNGFCVGTWCFLHCAH